MVQTERERESTRDVLVPKKLRFNFSEIMSLVSVRKTFVQIFYASFRYVSFYYIMYFKLSRHFHIKYYKIYGTELRSLSLYI